MDKKKEISRNERTDASVITSCIYAVMDIPRATYSSRIMASRVVVRKGFGERGDTGG